MLSTATVTSRSTLAEQDEEIILAAYRVVGCFTAPYSPGKAERLCRLLEAQVAACAASQAAYERYRNPDTAAETKPAMHDMQPYAGGRWSCCAGKMTAATAKTSTPAGPCS